MGADRITTSVEILRQHPDPTADDISEALRHAALTEFAGALPDVFEPDELDRLRDEWD